MLAKIKSHSHILHKTGMFLSLLCLVHCLAMPFIVTLLPLVAKDYFSHATEIYLVLGSLVIAVFLMRKDFQVHQKKLPFLLLSGATLLQVIGLFFVPEDKETLFVVSGSLLLLLAYLINYKYHSKSCSHHRH